MIRVYFFQKGVDDYAKYSFPGNQNLERIYSFVIQMTIPLSDIHEYEKMFKFVMDVKWNKTMIL